MADWFVRAIAVVLCGLGMDRVCIGTVQGQVAPPTAAITPADAARVPAPETAAALLQEAAVQYENGAVQIARSLYAQVMAMRANDGARQKAAQELVLTFAVPGAIDIERCRTWIAQNMPPEDGAYVLTTIAKWYVARDRHDEAISILESKLRPSPEDAGLLAECRKTREAQEAAIRQHLSPGITLRVRQIAIPQVSIRQSLSEGITLRAQRIEIPKELPNPL